MKPQAALVAFFLGLALIASQHQDQQLPAFIFLPFFVSGAANSISGDCQGTYCAIPLQSLRASRDQAYTMGFSPAPVFNNHHGNRNDCGYGTNQPKSRSSMQTFSKSGTLPSYFNQQLHEAAVAGAPAHKQSPNIVTVATELEVATIFQKNKKSS